MLGRRDRRERKKESSQHFQSLDHMEGMLAHWEYIHVNCNFLEKKEIPLAMRPFIFFETYFKLSKYLFYRFSVSSCFKTTLFTYN